MRHDLAAVREFDPAAVPAGTVARVTKAFATAPDGGAACYPLIVIAGAAPGPTAALVGGIHGDEYEGPKALWSLLEAIRPEGLAGRLVIVPVAHLAAFSAGTRTSPVDGANLAGSFPGDPAGTITQRLADDLFETVVRRADFLVDLHSGGVRLAFLRVAGWYAADGGIADRLAERSLDLARDLGLPHLWKLPAREGVLSYEAMKAGIAATGDEAGGRGGCLDDDWQAYLLGLRRILVKRGMIDAPELPPAPHHSKYLDGDWELAPCSGYLDPIAPLGAAVRAGDPLARILTPGGEVAAILQAKADGLVMAVRHLRTIHEGEWATCAVRVVNR